MLSLLIKKVTVGLFVIVGYPLTGALSIVKDLPVEVNIVGSMLLDAHWLFLIVSTKPANNWPVGPLATLEVDSSLLLIEYSKSNVLVGGVTFVLAVC